MKNILKIIVYSITRWLFSYAHIFLCFHIQMLEYDKVYNIA